MGDLAIDFCGEWHEPSDEDIFSIGREGDLEVDDNPYLHRQFLPGVDELEQQREPAIGRRSVAEQLPGVFRRDLPQGTAGERTGGDDALRPVHVGQHPGLADRVGMRGRLPHDLGQPGAAPEHGLEQRPKGERRQHN